MCPRRWFSGRTILRPTLVPQEHRSQQVRQYVVDIVLQLADQYDSRHDKLCIRNIKIMPRKRAEELGSQESEASISDAFF